MFPRMILLGSIAVSLFCGAVSCGEASKVSDLTQPGSEAPSAIVISPDSSTLNVGDTLSLNATLLDASGSKLSGTATTWSSSDTLVARVSQTGLVTGVTTGVATVTAQANETKKTAMVWIQGDQAVGTPASPVDSSPVAKVAATLTKLTIAPKTASMVPGGAQQFTVSGIWSDGSTTAPTTAYTASGGTITATGLYAAGSLNGSFKVIAVQSGGTKADTAVVSIAPLPATSLAVVTQPSGAISGTHLTQQPVVALRNAQNQVVLQSGIVVTAAIASGTGTLSGSLSTNTNAQGQAVFAGLQITGSGTVAISFTAPGLIQTTSNTLTVGSSTLRALAAARGFSIGAAVRDTAFSRDAQYRQTLATQYNSIVPEDATDFWPIQPGPAQYNFAPADSLVAFAQANGMAFHGHTLVWHAWIPTWVTSGGYTATQLRAILKDHITTVVGRYRGKVASWDVVNEVFDNADGGVQDSFWQDSLGPAYIDSAFVWAHRADPAAKLYLNEYGTETINAKSTAVLALAEALRARGVPIDGVGFQTHIYQQYWPLPTSAQVQANFQRFADAGFYIRITEMDVDIPDGAGASALATQASVYSLILNACLNVSRCTDLTTWGFSDKYSYVPTTFPGYGRALPFDANFQPKPAFSALLTRLAAP